MNRFACLLLLLAGCGGPGPGPGPEIDGGADDAPASAADLAPGGCAPACGGLTPHCNGARRCVACLSDDHCPPGTYCKATADGASCVPGCQDDKRCAPGRCCSGRCADLATDPAHCGGCGKACTGNHARASCVAAACTLGPCDAGWGDCNKDPKDGCETNLHIDANHCTACGTACAIANAYAACADGCYMAACKWGFADCNRDDKDGCETPVLADPASCGACGKSCQALPNAQARCVSGACVLGSCNPGFFDCDGAPANGCEAGLQFDKLNCGQCGAKCPINTPYCNQGRCGNVGNRVLVVYAASQSYFTDVSARLKAENVFSVVDGFNAGAGTPTLAQLQAYDALLVFSDAGFQSAAGLGDVVAAYFEAGGRVVVATFANASVAITGGWTKYQLIQPAGQEQPNDSLGQILEPQSPLMVGVKTLTATAAYRSTGGAINGGIVVAQWQSGKPLVVRGVLRARNVVSLNFYPPGSGQNSGRNDFWMGDGAALLRNALLFN